MRNWGVSLKVIEDGWFSMRFEGEHMVKTGVLEKPVALSMTGRLTVLFLILLVGLFLVPVVSNGQRLPKDIKKRMDEAMILVETAPDSAMAMSWQIWEDVESERNLYLMGVVRSFLGYQGFQIGDSEMSYMHFLSALELLEQSDTVDYYNLATASDNLANIYIEFNMPRRAMESLEKGVLFLNGYLKNYLGGARYAEFESRLSEAKFFLLIQYTDGGDFPKAESLLKELEDSGQDYLSRAEIVNKKGIIKKKMNKPEEAVRYFIEVFKSKESNGADKAIACHNLGVVYSDLNMLNESEKWFRTALERTELLHDPESVFMTSLDLGEVLFAHGRVQEAIEQWEYCLQVLSELKTPDLFIIYDWLEKGHKALGRNDLAEAYDLLYVKYKEEHDNSIEALKASDEREAFEGLVNRLREEKLKKDIRKDYLLLIVVAVIAVVLLVVLTISRIRKSKQKKLYQELGDILLEDD